VERALLCNEAAPEGKASKWGFVGERDCRRKLSTL
jgi:hypothetical protein